MIYLNYCNKPLAKSSSNVMITLLSPKERLSPKNVAAALKISPKRSKSVCQIYVEEKTHLGDQNAEVKGYYPNWLL